MRVRSATIDDIGFLSEVSREVQRLHAQALPELFKPPGPDAYTEAFFRQLLQHPDAVVLVAEREGKRAGFVRGMILREPETPVRYAWTRLHFKHIGVAAGEEGKGVGHALVSAGVRFARERGIRTITGDVWAFNARMREFLAREQHYVYCENQWLDVNSYDEGP